MANTDNDVIGQRGENAPHDELHKDVGGVLYGGSDQGEGLLLRLEGGAGGEILTACVAAVTCCRFGQLDGAASGLCLARRAMPFFVKTDSLKIPAIVVPPVKE